jgi:hypothetical protein
MNLKLLILPLVLLISGAVFSFVGDRPAMAAADLPTPSVQRFEYPGADSVNVSSQQCTFDGRVSIQVSWTSYNLGLQWLDLSLFNNGFAWGTFVGLGPLAPSANSQEWGGLLPGQWHFLRVNTLAWFGWAPSSTVSFYTRADCGGGGFVDSDGDGIPNNVDACPFQYGFPQYNGCPVPQGGGVQPYMCGGGWCPGQPAPVQFCGGGGPPAVLVVGPRGCVWVLRGEGSSYRIGEQVTICYWVSEPMHVLIRSQTPAGFAPDVVNGNDDGRGNCVNVNAQGQPLVVGQPAGQRTTRLYTGNTLLDETVWYGTP